MRAARPTTTSSLALGAEVNFFGDRGRRRARLPDVHARRRRAPQGARARALGGGRPRPGAGRRRRAQRRRRRRRPDRASRAPARWPSSTAATSPRTIRSMPQDKARADPRRGRARRSSRCSSRTSASTREKALEKRGVEVMLGESVASVDADAGHAEVGHSARRAHARLGRRAAGEPGRPRARRRAERGRPHPGRARPDASPAIPRCSPSATSPGSPTRRPARCCRSSARSRCSRASTPARTSPGASAGKETKPFEYHDKGTMATIGRGAAVVQYAAGAR